MNLIFKKIKQFFINKMYRSCFEELTLIKNFYRANILYGDQFKDRPEDTRIKLFEEGVLMHLPYDSFNIYRKKFGEDFKQHLAVDAFGYTYIKDHNVSVLFDEYCRRNK